MDPSLPDLILDLLPKAEMWRCDQCGQCSGVCPSYRHGGIRTREVIERASTGSLDLDSDRSVWKCMMCQGCTERCQLGADPAMVITLVRNLAAEAGNRPECFADEARLFIRTGLSFPCTGMTRKLRREMGLPDLEVDEASLRDVRLIIERTRMGRLGLEE